MHISTDIQYILSVSQINQLEADIFLFKFKCWGTN